VGAIRTSGTLGDRREHVLVGGCQPVRSSGVDLEGRAFDDLGSESAGVVDRHDLVGIAVHDKELHHFASIKSFT
jgi:hypothetical protein